jgi:hypothetical protein
MLIRRFSKAVAVSPSDTVDLPAGTIGLYVGTGGIIVVDFGDDGGNTVASDVTFLNFPSGQGLSDFQFKKLKLATTAQNVLALIGR